MTRVPRITDYPAFLEAWGDLARAPRKPDAPTLVSVYAGAGGSSTGYRMAGYDVRLGVDFWDRAVESYNANWPGRGIQVDMTQADPAAIMAAAGLAPGELDVLDTSEPCQGVSLAGRRQLDDPRNRLFLETARLVKHARPKVVIRENVAGMVRGKMRPLFREVTQHMRDLGYRVGVKVLDASWLGVPQERHRLVWIGVRDDLADDALADYHPAPTWRPPSLAQGLQGVIGFQDGALQYGGGNGDADNVEPAKRRPAKTVHDPASTVVARRLPTVKGARGHFAESVERSADRPAMTVTSNEPPRLREYPGHTGNKWDKPAKAIKAGTHGTPGGEHLVPTGPLPGLEQNVRQSRHKVRKGDKPSKTVTAGHQRRSHGGAAPRADGKPGPTLTGKAPPQVRLREVAHGFKPGGLREQGRPAPAITTDPWDREVDDGGGWRRMTPRECMRLQSVPDWYRVLGNKTEQTKQVGNMVPPLMAAQVGCAIAHRILRWPDAPKPLEVSKPWTR